MAYGPFIHLQSQQSLNLSLTFIPYSDIISPSLPFLPSGLLNKCLLHHGCSQRSVTFSKTYLSLIFQTLTSRPLTNQSSHTQLSKSLCIILLYKADDQIRHPKFYAIGRFSLTAVFQDSRSLFLICICILNQLICEASSVYFLFFPSWL